MEPNLCYCLGSRHRGNITGGQIHTSLRHSEAFGTNSKKELLNLKMIKETDFHALVKMWIVDTWRHLDALD